MYKMTRAQQWRKRRMKYLRISRRQWNARFRTYDSGYPYHTTVISHPGYWLAKGDGSKQRALQIVPKNIRAAKLHGRPRGWLKSPELIGYANPPHYQVPKNSVPWWGPPPHQEGGHSGGPERDVKYRGHKIGRAKGKDYLAYVAWVYWRKRGVWPSWDVKGRTPVDPQTPGRDDPW